MSVGPGLPPADRPQNRRWPGFPAPWAESGATADHPDCPFRSAPETGVAPAPETPGGRPARRASTPAANPAPATEPPRYEWPRTAQFASLLCANRGQFELSWAPSRNGSDLHHLID